MNKLELMLKQFDFRDSSDYYAMEMLQASRTTLSCPENYAIGYVDLSIY